MSGSVSIIICTRNRADSLRETLASIGKCAVPRGLAAEVLVVDNGSTDHTLEIVRKAGLTNMPVRYVSEMQPGQTRARNAGLRASAADMVLFTDDDVLVPENWIGGMCPPILGGEADAVAGSIHFPAHYERLLAREPFRSRRGWFASSENIDPVQPQRMVGANMAFSRRVIETIKQFDTELGPGALGFYDDTLFSLCLKEAGFRLVAAPDISVEHHFDLSRLTRRTLLSMAERMGNSEAYVVYHWPKEGATANPAKERRAWLLLFGTRLLTPWNPVLGQTPSWELQRVQTLAFWRQLARCAGTPRTYQTEVTPLATTPDAPATVR